MFSCCVPVSRGCRLRGARGHDASRSWRQWIRSCTGRLRSLARRDPKVTQGDPETASPSQQCSDLTCAAPGPLPSVCVCVCVCVCLCVSVWKEGSCVEGPPEQVQADEGVRCLVGGSGSHPRQGWMGGTGCAGVALLSPRFIQSPAGGCHCVPGAGLCTLRSVSDLGAAGREGGRTLRMAGQAVMSPGRPRVTVFTEINR